MSLRNNFRIRSRDSSYGTSKGASLHPEQETWFDELRKKKLRCRKTLDDSYGNISLQQMQLRSAIRGASVENLNPGKQNSIANINSQTSINEQEDNAKPVKNVSHELKTVSRALTHLQGEFVPSRVDNYHLNQQLVRKDNDAIWNKLAMNPRQPQLMLYKSHSAEISGRSNCCFKVSKMHRKYILKVVVPEGRYGLVLSKDQWEALWKDYPSFELIAASLKLGQAGKLVISTPRVQLEQDSRDESHTTQPK